MIKRILISAIAIFLLIANVRADEGMWIPILLKKYNIEDMQKAGFKLTAEDIYDVNNACLKDAVVGLGREGRPFRHFCTGELVSGKGLMFTNHHCGFGAIQSHSTLEHNYLKDGFWAMNQKEELSNPGITASILKRIEDVTAKVFKGVDKNADEKTIQSKINENILKIVSEAQQGTHLRASVKPFFNGNQYFMAVYEIFKDVRLVGAPPSAIGKFGGDTDNWMWPRHTGDFSVFRIYAGKDNKPASFSKDNKPYQPKKFFNISIKGVKENDFTMVFGYPGTTTEYLTSYALNLMTGVSNPHKINIRTNKLKVINSYMNADEGVRIKYAAKAAGVANSWKRWKGEIKGLKRFNTIKNKQEQEVNFQAWANNKTEYKNVLPELKKLYKEMEPYQLAYDYAVEAGFRGAEAVGLAGGFRDFKALKKGDKNLPKFLKGAKSKIKSFFKDYDFNVDKNIFIECVKLYKNKLDPKYQPEIFNFINKKFKGDVKKYADYAYSKSIFSTKEKLDKFLDSYKVSNFKKIQKDPLYKFYNSLRDNFYNKVRAKFYSLSDKTEALQKVYMKGLMEMQPNKVFYPDANSTFRVHFGKVKGYSPRDGVYYNPTTTLEGIMEKDNPEIYDYDVPAKLKELYKTKNYGRYAENGTVNVCFVATNHTTGGNSGSPILNANGELIGLNFDRAWEGVMSDLYYNAEICRNIGLDVRYVLFIIDKFAGAGYLLDEMNIIE